MNLEENSEIWDSEDDIEEVPFIHHLNEEFEKDFEENSKLEGYDKFFVKEISHLMYLFGDVKDNCPDSAFALRVYLEEHAKTLIYEASQVAEQRGDNIIRFESVLRLITANKQKLQRLMSYLKLRDSQSEYTETSTKKAPEERYIRTRKMIHALSKHMTRREVFMIFEGKMPDKLEYMSDLIEKKESRFLNITYEDFNNFIKMHNPTYLFHYFKQFTEYLFTPDVTSKRPTKMAFEVINFLTLDSLRQIVEEVILIREYRLLSPLINKSVVKEFRKYEIEDFHFEDFEESFNDRAIDHLRSYGNWNREFNKKTKNKFDNFLRGEISLSELTNEEARERGESAASDKTNMEVIPLNEGSSDIVINQSGWVPDVASVDIKENLSPIYTFISNMLNDEEGREKRAPKESTTDPLIEANDEANMEVIPPLDAFTDQNNFPSEEAGNLPPEGTEDVLFQSEDEKSTQRVKCRRQNVDENVSSIEEETAVGERDRPIPVDECISQFLRASYDIIDITRSKCNSSMTNDRDPDIHISLCKSTCRFLKEMGDADIDCIFDSSENEECNTETDDAEAVFGDEFLEVNAKKSVEEKSIEGEEVAFSSDETGMPELNSENIDEELDYSDLSDDAHLSDLDNTLSSYLSCISNCKETAACLYSQPIQKYFSCFDAYISEIVNPPLEKDAEYSSNIGPFFIEDKISDAEDDIDPDKDESLYEGEPNVFDLAQTQDVLPPNCENDDATMSICNDDELTDFSDLLSDMDIDENHEDVHNDVYLLMFDILSHFTSDESDDADEDGKNDEKEEPSKDNKSVNFCLVESETNKGDGLLFMLDEMEQVDLENCKGNDDISLTGEMIDEMFARDSSYTPERLKDIVSKNSDSDIADDSKVKHDDWRTLNEVDSITRHLRELMFEKLNASEVNEYFKLENPKTAQLNASEVNEYFKLENTKSPQHLPRGLYSEESIDEELAPHTSCTEDGAAHESSNDRSNSSLNVLNLLPETSSYSADNMMNVMQTDVTTLPSVETSGMLISDIVEIPSNDWEAALNSTEYSTEVSALPFLPDPSHTKTDEIVLCQGLDLVDSSMEPLIDHLKHTSESGSLVCLNDLLTTDEAEADWGVKGMSTTLLTDVEEDVTLDAEEDVASDVDEKRNLKIWEDYFKYIMADDKEKEVDLGKRASRTVRTNQWHKLILERLDEHEIKEREHIDDDMIRSIMEEYGLKSLDELANSVEEEFSDTELVRKKANAKSKHSKKKQPLKRTHKRKLNPIASKSITLVEAESMDYVGAKHFDSDCAKVFDTEKAKSSNYVGAEPVETDKEESSSSVGTESVDPDEVDISDYLEYYNSKFPRTKKELYERVFKKLSKQIKSDEVAEKIEQQIMAAYRELDDKKFQGPDFEGFRKSPITQSELNTAVPWLTKCDKPQKKKKIMSRTIYGVRRRVICR